LPENGDFLLEIIVRVQEIPVRVQESCKILQEILVRLQENGEILQEFVVRVQENVKFLRENVVRVQEISEFLQEIGHFPMDYGRGIKENLLVFNELSENVQKRHF
jgi:septation ring formation regulator EzrA